MSRVSVATKHLFLHSVRLACFSVEVTSRDEFLQCISCRDMPDKNYVS